MNPRSFRLISILSVALILAPTSPTNAETAPSPAQELTTYEKKMASYGSDLNDIAKGLAGLDQQIASMLIDLAAHNRMQISHVQDLLLIDSLLQDEADRRRIKPIN